MRLWQSCKGRVQEGKAVLAATTHMDLFEDMKPSIYIHKRFGKKIKVEYYPNEVNRPKYISSGVNPL